MKNPLAGIGNYVVIIVPMLRSPEREAAITAVVADAKAVFEFNGEQVDTIKAMPQQEQPKHKGKVRRKK